MVSTEVNVCIAGIHSSQINLTYLTGKLLGLKNNNKLDEPTEGKMKEQ